ncbi:MAG: TrkA family potassium uptake protein [Anaerolineae bacterium]|jgi:trk system potassium uptake protein|nr:TrkA family potassium uptake protein [Anaerolineae bacterium]MBT7324298.1 TrkA family potassium uptake protein [Anaerolineae bacterium]
MFRKNKKKPEFAVIGLGRFGRAVVKTLVAKGFSVLGVDRDEKSVQIVLDLCTQAVILDSTNEDALRELDIGTFDTVVVAIGADFESNLITTAALKAIGVRRIICKALSTRQKDILLSIGASEVIQPEADAGHQLALELAAPNLLDRIPLGDKHTILELMVTSSMHEKTLVDADFRKLYDVSVMAIKRENDITISPSGDFLMQEGDILVVLGEVDKITNLEELT